MLRSLHSVVLAVLVLGTGCSNGGSGPSSANAGACSSGAGAFCLASCNLGCSPNGGCSITDVAPNQPIEFRFSQVIDPSTVDSSSISIRTSAGQEPIGALVVEGDKVIFRPEVRFVQGATFFGFTTNETYTITLAGGNAPNAIASTSGDRLEERFVCTVRVTLDVVDVDPRAPFAELVSPTTTSLASRDSIFTLEFNEIIDFAPFFNVPAEQQPIRYRVRRNLTTNGQRECDAASASIPLSGTPRLSNDLETGKSIATFTPFETLPGDTCIEIEVTNLVRDLSGQRAPREFFRITLAADSLQPRSTEFDFQDDLLLDPGASGGVWGNTEATFAQVGGDGRHGVFNFEDGERDPATGFYDFSTDDQELSGYPFTTEALLNGNPRVTDGAFFFTRFEIPVGVTVRFVGSQPAKIFVRGECSIQGRLIVNGESTADAYDGTLAMGQDGGIGGAGGGAGGNGAFKGTNDGNPNQPALNNFFGFDGQDVQVPMGHAFGMQVGGTGGTGGSPHPNNNDLSTVILPPSFFPAQIDYAGGYAGGGGFVTPGGDGAVVAAQTALTTGSSPDFRGADAPGGSDFTPFVSMGRPAGVRSIDFYLIGGAGGGGGGSQPFVANLLQRSYWSGGGGGGGGGAVGLFVGNSLSLEATGSVEARGGDSGSHVPTALSPIRGVAAVGGGGSGGSILIQVENSLQVLGGLDVRGGNGADELLDPSLGGMGCTPGVPCTGYLEASGGDGGEGFLRIEQTGAIPPLPSLVTAMPAVSAMNVGEIEDPNDLSGFMSVFVSTNEVFSPIFDRYVIVADVDGVPTTFSDDPSVGQAAVEGAPLRFYIQGTDIDTLTGQPPLGSTPSPWRQSVGFSMGGEPTLNSDAPLGFRFTLIRDSQVSSNVVVRSVRIEYQS